jgi:hypothetical protein
MGVRFVPVVFIQSASRQAVLLIVRADLQPDLGQAVAQLGMVVGVWQGIVLRGARPSETPLPEELVP